MGKNIFLFVSDMDVLHMRHLYETKISKNIEFNSQYVKTKNNQFFETLLC